MCSMTLFELFQFLIIRIWQNMGAPPSEDWQNLGTPSDKWRNMGALSKASTHASHVFLTVPEMFYKTLNFTL